MDKLIIIYHVKRSLSYSTHAIALLLDLLVFNLHSQFGNFTLFRVRVHRLISIEKQIQLFLARHLTIRNDSHQVEMNLTFAVLLDSSFDEGTRHFEPIVTCRSPIDWTLAESVELIQPAVDWNVRDEVENVFVFCTFGVVQLKECLTSERVVNRSNHAGIAECESFVESVEWLSELFEFRQGFAELQIWIVDIQEDRQNSLSGACIVDYLQRQKNNEFKSDDLQNSLFLTCFAKNILSNRSSLTTCAGSSSLIILKRKMRPWQLPKFANSWSSNVQSSSTCRNKHWCCYSFSTVSGDSVIVYLCSFHAFFVHLGIKLWLI